MNSEPTAGSFVHGKILLKNRMYRLYNSPLMAPFGRVLMHSRQKGTAFNIECGDAEWIAGRQFKNVGIASEWTIEKAV